MCLPSEAETASNGGRLPSNVEPAPIKELVEHRQDLSALLQPAAWSTPARRNPSLALISGLTEKWRLDLANDPTPHWQPLTAALHLSIF